MDALHFFEAYREFILDIAGGLCIEGQFRMVMEAVFLLWYSQAEVPLHPRGLPVFIPFVFRTGPDKKLHLHLFELTHPEDELSRDDLVPERLPDLCNPERDLHAPGL